MKRILENFLKKEKALPFLVFILGVLFHLFLTLHNSLVISTGQHNFLDYSIYLQALQNISYAESFNPYLSVRGMKVYNDHFDLILHPIAFILKWLPGGFKFTVGLDLFFLILTGIFALREMGKKEIPFNSQFFILLLLFGNQFFAQGLKTPFHPSTWAIFPTFAWAYSLCQKDWKSAFCWITFLSFFKEVYAVFLVIFALYMLYLKEKKIFSYCLGTIFIYIGLLVLIRHDGFSSIYFTQFVKNESLLSVIARNGDLLTVVWFMAPFLTFLIKKDFEKKISGETIVLLLCFIIYYATHIVLDRKITVAHYAPTVGALFLGYLMARAREIKIYQLLIAISLLLLQWFHPVSHLVNSIAYNSNNPLSKNTHYKIEEIKKELDSGKNILATYNLTPFLINPPRDVKTFTFNEQTEDIGMIGILKSPIYFSDKKVQNLIEICRQGEILSEYNSDEIYIAKGLFPKDCLAPLLIGLLRDEQLNQEEYRSIFKYRLKLGDLWPF